VQWLSHRLKAGSVYVHCALGHGRTGCIVSAYLLATGVVPSIGEAVNLLRSLRPGVDLNRDQRRALRAFAKELGEKG
jgi:protein-tyrosine phosphatase